MQTHRYNTLSHTLSAFLLFFLSPPLLSCAAAPATQQDLLLRSSCAQARYPNLCVQTLSNSAGPAMKPLDLAQAAVRVSLAHARTLSGYLKNLQLQAKSGSSNWQRGAVSDCVAQISDSVNELSNTLNELQHLQMGKFEWHMSNAQTWISTAMTDGQSCLNGFKDGNVEGKLKLDVNRRVTGVAMLTSNALYLINRLGASRNGKPRSNSKTHF
ncbi:pectinesterase inhibitor 3-like [Gastrolobium bilobum]|uniref:pectinesterase inhibitor 3-like n=1 Tax=Gastrolobium bilobum TaxID=150636 RepID=UPI002AB0EF00|nr:pectinesterase inhibitor 3-like [Gastrolobium bilobum]